ncbi:aldo/keto reductase [Streptantibioticus silvisoli]|uniref:aldo/keto reductase n=1 Tax=Streptantibioticus silvisoli TaxID=2705255 RepID=UPI0026E59179
MVAPYSKRRREFPVSTAPVRRLNDGTTVPALGLGTYPMDDAQAERAVAGALELGYRLIDTAVRYGNEAGTGRGIARSGVPREDITVTTKLPGRDHGYDSTLASFEASRRRLGLEYVDLYLIHWPLPRVGKFTESWRAMVKLREDGLVRSLGVSNFTPQHIDRLERETGVLPSVNQVELHPMLPQHALRAADAERGVVTQSWSPLGRGSGLLADPAVAAVAAAHGVTPGQALLRWHVQLGAVPIPKSGDPERQRLNLDVFGFELTDAEMAAIGDRPERRLGGDPDTHEEF